MHWQHAWQLSESWYESDDRVIKPGCAESDSRVYADLVCPLIHSMDSPSQSNHELAHALVALVVRLDE